MAKTGKRQVQTKITQPTPTRNLGQASRRPSTPDRTRRGLGERTAISAAASHRLSVAEKLGISNHRPARPYGAYAAMDAARTERGTTDATLFSLAIVCFIVVPG